MTPLRRKMLEDLQLRNYSAGTQGNYVRAVAQFARHFNRSPDLLGAAEVRRYLLYLVQERRVSASTYTVALCALRFFYHITLGRDDVVQSLPRPHFLGAARIRSPVWNSS